MLEKQKVPEPVPAFFEGGGGEGAQRLGGGGVRPVDCF
jgi:hypothetical protein